MGCRSGSSSRWRHPSTRRLFQLGIILPGQQDEAAHQHQLEGLPEGKSNAWTVSLDLLLGVLCTVSRDVLWPHYRCCNLASVTSGLAPHAYFEHIWTDSMQWHTQNLLYICGVFSALFCLLFFSCALSVGDHVHTWQWNHLSLQSTADPHVATVTRIPCLPVCFGVLNDQWMSESACRTVATLFCLLFETVVSFCILIVMLCTVYLHCSVYSLIAQKEIRLTVTSKSGLRWRAYNVLWWLWHNWGPTAGEMATLLMKLAGDTFELALKLQR